jgi:ABC-type transport system involved in cytochrome bd biosynthesis fused ATPase/permease subunit
MKTGTGLALIAIGAILAFAVTANTSVFNIHVAGWVILLVGLAGLFIPRRSYAWVNRRFVQRRSRTWPSGRRAVETTETSLPLRGAGQPRRAGRRRAPAGCAEPPPPSRGTSVRRLAG